MAGETVFVIDDDTGTRKFNAQGLRRKGYNAVEFDTVDEALEHLQTLLPRDLPAAIVTDNDTRSAVTGLQLLQEARKISDASVAEGGKAIALIMSAAGPSEEDVKKAGGPETKFLEKGQGYSVRKLTETVDGMLGNQQRQPLEIS